MRLPNYVSGRWGEGLGSGELLVDPVTGDELVSISSEGIDLEAALQFARAHGGPALRQLTYTQRADLLAKIAEALAANRDEYFRLSLVNLGATPADASFDVDGAIYTMKYYAKIGPDVASGTDLFDLLVKEVVREMTLKAGQKCTTIRRVLIPREQLKAFGDTVTARLSSMKVGNPRNPEAKVGPVVSKAQQSSCLEGLARLKEECEVLFGGEKNFQPIDADVQKSAFVQPALLSCKRGLDAKYVHDVEVFGPVATLMAYDGLEDLIAITRRGLGSLVASVFSNDLDFTREAILGIGDLHGRVLAVNSTVGGQHTGHGNVVPSCLHGGPGRAGGGEELAGLRALLLYHRRFVVQGPTDCITELVGLCADTAPLYS